ncbi:hypothetical protein FQN55_008763 [Onygenales sp. PD_40]|nr:hypothetical protein FQN55_008763 [Onygenales sp. PD_40]
MPKLNRTLHDLAAWFIASTLSLLIIYPIYHANLSLEQHLSPSHPLLVTYILNPLYTIFTLTIVLILIAQTLLYITLADGTPWQNRDEFTSYIKGTIFRNSPPPPPKKKTPRRPLTPVQPVFVTTTEEEAFKKSQSRTWRNWTTASYSSRPWNRRRDTNEPTTRVLAQEHSPVFSMLPLEIRRMVYRYVLGGGPIHIMYRQFTVREYSRFRPGLSEMKMGHLRCGGRRRRGEVVNPSEGEGDDGYRRCWSNVGLEIHGFKTDAKHADGFPKDGFYLESIDILYTSNHLNFPSLSTLVKFLTAIPRSRLNSLSSISTHERALYTRIFKSTLSRLYTQRWKPLLQILACSEMGTLRHVRVTLDVGGLYNAAGGLPEVSRLTEEQERWFFGLLGEDGEIGAGIGEKVKRGLEVEIEVTWSLFEGTVAALPGWCRVRRVLR